MKYEQPKLCMNCKHSKLDKHSGWNNRCYHPIVIMSDSWALANNDEGQPCGVCCRDERQRKWFTPCGMKGKLFEVKLAK